jgi:hypothetical protein
MTERTPAMAGLVAIMDSGSAAERLSRRFSSLRLPMARRFAPR